MSQKMIVLGSGRIVKAKVPFDESIIRSPPEAARAKILTRSRIKKPISSRHNRVPIPDPGREREGEVGGLTNLGNNCFTKAALQCLLNTPSLVQYFLSGNCSTVLGNSKALRTGKFALVSKFLELVKQTWVNDQDVLDLTDVNKFLGEAHAQLKDNNQHDVHELLSLLLESLHQQIIQAQKIYFKGEKKNTDRIHFVLKPSSKSNLKSSLKSNGVRKSSRNCSDFEAGKYWEEHLRKENTVISRTMQGLIKNSVVCAVCHLESITFVPFTQLFIPVPLGPTWPRWTNSEKLRFDIHTCLQIFTTTEFFKMDSTWFCPGCKINQKASKVLSFARFPDNLIICLKRFVVNPDGIDDKLLAKVEFPLMDLDLSAYLPEELRKTLGGSDSTFDLYGCICHEGSIDSGHYNAYIKNPLTHDWNFYNNGRLKFSENEVPGEKQYSSVYSLFYKRQNVDYSIPKRILVEKPFSTKNIPARPLIGDQKSHPRLQLRRSPPLSKLQNTKPSKQYPGKKGKPFVDTSDSDSDLEVGCEVNFCRDPTKPRTILSKLIAQVERKGY